MRINFKAHRINSVDLYNQMVKNYCHRARRQMLPVLTATLSLTHDYLTHCTTRATAILSKHAATFQVQNINPFVM